ncbi:MAG: hypothetical protein RJA99_3646 [Pseudomonadota bacterium]|jgi:uncharacterized iron-regulated protein
MDIPTIRTLPLAALAAAALVAACASTPGGALAPGAAPHGPPRERPVTPLPSPAAPAARALPADPQALADAMRGAPVVLLGEIHDNAAQHALRADALARLVAGGARPALAFEQLDRDDQAEIDRLRRERPGDVDALAALVARRGWDAPLYRPYLAIALANDLPVIGANLSRGDASRVVREGFAAAFDAPTRAALGLDALPAPLLAAHAREIDAGHCGLLPAAMLEPMARAQIARDAALARAIESMAGRGVVLITGNGHARRDLGVPNWLSPALRARTVSIGLVEPAARDALPHDAFDRVVSTEPQSRQDPCEALKARMRPAQGR